MDTTEPEVQALIEWLADQGPRLAHKLITETLMRMRTHHLTLAQQFEPHCTEPTSEYEMDGPIEHMTHADLCAKMFKLHHDKAASLKMIVQPWRQSFIEYKGQPTPLD